MTRSQTVNQRGKGIMNAHQQESFSTAIEVDQSPEEVFAAINNVRGWWPGEIEGGTERPGEEFTYRHKDIHRSRQKITESVPGHRVVWQVVEGYLKFTRDPAEWTGTEIAFDIARKGDRTEVRFTHRGLVPAVECFDACTSAWSFLVQRSLRDLITTGKGDLDGF